MLRLTDEGWRRHANAWSVYTRFAAIPAMVIAIWSRTWLGPIALAAVAAVAVWLLLNPWVFPPVEEPRRWSEKGIFGERLWLRERSRVPKTYRVILRRLVILGLAGMAVTAWGLVRLDVWPTVFGAVLVVVAQLWRIDRMGLLYDEVGRPFKPEQFPDP